MIEAVVAILVLLFCFYLLSVICEEFFVPSLDVISNRLKLPSDVAGATFMAAGSSAPELFTSLIAVLKSGGLADVGSGTIVGSAIFNILVIIGASALYKTVKLTWQPVIRDTVFYIFTILLLLFAFWDGKIVWTEAFVFVLMYGLYILAVIYWKRILPYSDVDPLPMIEQASEENAIARLSKRMFSTVIPDPHRSAYSYIRTFSMSILLIIGLSYALVESVVFIADFFRINPTFLALTVLAAGTSIPDLLSSMIVARQGRGDMAVSNAVGSNIFDILFGLGMPWFIVLTFSGGSIPVIRENLLGSVFLLFATVVAILFILVVRKWKIGQKSGVVLILFYLGYIAYTFANVR